MAARQVLLRSPAVARRPDACRSIGEVAGGTAAECAAVVCCCPCAVVELLVMAVYKLPAGLCKRAWRKNKRMRLARKRKSLQLRQAAAGDQSQQAAAAAESSLDASDMAMVVTNDVAAGEVEEDDDVWPPRFYGTGFWRSPDNDD